MVPHDEVLKYRILFEAHDTAITGHFGREKTYGMVYQTYWCPKMYKWVSTYVRTCEPCQRVKLCLACPRMRMETQVLWSLLID